MLFATVSKLGIAFIVLLLSITIQCATREKISDRLDSPFRIASRTRGDRFAAVKSGRRRLDKGKRKRRKKRAGGERCEERKGSKEVNCPEIFNPAERPRDLSFIGSASEQRRAR